MSKVPATLFVLAFSSVAGAQNLLVNPSFNSPPSPGAPAQCNPNSTANSSFPGWDDSTGMVKRNDNVGAPACTDGAFMGYSGQAFSRWTYQTVTGLPSPAADYTFSGLWSHTVVFGETSMATFRAEVHSGSDPNANLLGETVKIKGCCNSENNFTPFAVSVSKPAGVTSLTVVLRTQAANAYGVAMHAEDTSLVQTTCVPLPSISGVSPMFGVRGAAQRKITVTGAGFIPGATVVRLTRAGQSDIVGSSPMVTGGGTSVSADFNLSGAALGEWNAQVDVTANGCPSTSAVSAFTVILPAFTNGSFEWPVAGAAECPADPIRGVPTDWLADEFVEWGFGNRLGRNGYMENNQTLEELPLGFLPSCPPPDGDHYGTMASYVQTSGPNARAYQTISVTPGAFYTFGGFFAGSGDNTAKIRLLNGGIMGTELAASPIHEDPSSYDWTYQYVSAQAAGEVMTAALTIRRDGGTPNAVHADALSVEQCVGETPSISTVSPVDGVNSGLVELTIDGFGFAGAPVVLLNRFGATVFDGSPTLVNSNRLLASFDLTNLPSGPYDVIVKQGGCIAEAEAPFVVAGLALVNGGFEDPSVAVDHGDCSLGDPPQPVGGLPAGWNTDAPDGMIRDGNAPLPPGAAMACVPSSNGGHYGTLSASGTLRAWQTISVIPGAEYELSGEFAGSGDFYLRLIDGGDPAGPASIAESLVFSGNSPSGQWVQGLVQGTAVSGVMTVVWEIRDAAPGGHADGLGLVNLSGDCHPVRPDHDGDGDVDQTDFAAFQRCHTGPGLFTLAPGCACFDSDGGEAGMQDIDMTDFTNLFAPCSTRAGVPQTDTWCDGFAP